jgi:hypothetical protein
MHRFPFGFRRTGAVPARAAAAWLRRGQLGPADIHQRIRTRGDREDGPFWGRR